MKAVIEEIGYCENDIEIKALIYRILHKQFYDYSGLVYGMGHAIYTLSDPRSEVLQEYIEKLAEKKGKVREYEFYQRFEQCAKEVILDVKGVHISSNVDFYSGFVYSMLELPLELYTPMFAIARIVGWSAHRMEELINTDKIIRPAYKNVLETQQYTTLTER